MKAPTSLTYDRYALVVFALLVFVYGYFLRSDLSDNETAHLGLAFAIVQEGRLTIDSFHDAPLTRTIDKSFYDGHYYSTKAPGTGLVSALVYGTIARPVDFLSRGFGWDATERFHLLKYLITMGAVGLPSAFSASTLYLLGALIVGDRWKAYVATMAIACGTMLWPFSTLLFAHALAAALLFVSFYLIVRVKLTPQSDHTWTAAGAAFLLGLAIQVEYTSAILVAGIALYALSLCVTGDIQISSLKQGIVASIGFLLPTAMSFAYNAACFGSPFSNAYSYVVATEFQDFARQGFFGIAWPDCRNIYYLTIHPYRGIFAQSPILIAAVIGFPAMIRTPRWRLEAALGLFAVAGYLFMNAGYACWWGGWTFGPRFLIPMLPFLALPLVLTLNRKPSFVMGLGLWSIAQMSIPTAGSPLTSDRLARTMAHGAGLPFFGTSPIFGEALQRLESGRYARNLGMLAGLHGWTSLLPLVVVVLGVSAYFFHKRSIQV